MTSDHTPSVSVDLAFPQGSVRIGTVVDAKQILVGEPAWFLAPLPAKTRPKMSSADRTRSPRWRAGTRRTRRLAREARRQGRPTPLAGTWTGWVDLGWTDES